MILLDWDTLVLKKVSHLKLQKKEETKPRMLSLHVTHVQRRATHPMYAEAGIPNSISSPKTQVTVTYARNRVITHMTADPLHSKPQDLKVTVITAKSMVIELLSADLNPCGHQINMQRCQPKEIITIGITTPEIVVTIAKNMDTLLKTA